MSKHGETRKYSAREDHDYRANGHQVPSTPDGLPDASPQQPHPDHSANRSMKDPNSQRPRPFQYANQVTKGSDQLNNTLTTSLTLERANSLGIHFPTLPKREPIPIEKWLPRKTEYPLRAVDPLTALNRRLAFPIFPESPTRAYHRDNDFFPVNKPFAVGTTLPTLLYHGGLFRNDDDEVKAVSMWFLETTYARHFMAELSTLRGVLRSYIVFDNKCRASGVYMGRIHALYLDDIAHLLSRATVFYDRLRECRGEKYKWPRFLDPQIMDRRATMEGMFESASAEWAQRVHVAQNRVEPIENTLNQIRWTVKRMNEIFSEGWAKAQMGFEKINAEFLKTLPAGGRSVDREVCGMTRWPMRRRSVF